MRKFWIAALSGLLALVPATLPAETLTDALIAAYRNSHLLEQNQAVLRAADEDLATAVGTLLPVISFQGSINGSGSYQPGRTTRRFDPVTNTFITVNIADQSPLALSDSAALIASMTLYDFGRGKLGIALRNELVLASQQSLVSVEQDVLLDAVSAVSLVASGRTGGRAGKQCAPDRAGSARRQ